MEPNAKIACAIKGGKCDIDGYESLWNGLTPARSDSSMPARLLCHVQ